MHIIPVIKNKYADYGLNKINELEMSLDHGDGLKSSPPSPTKLMPDKLKITLKTLPRQLSIARNMEYTVKSLENDAKNPKTLASHGFLRKFEELAHSMGVAKVRYVKVNPELIFQHRSIKYPYAMVLIMEMVKDAVDNALSPETQKMGVVPYDHLGKITNELTHFIREAGFGAQTSPPAGGFVIYPALAQKAGLGFIGGMAC